MVKMDFKTLEDSVGLEIGGALSAVDEDEIKRFIAAIISAKDQKIFVMGVGRVMLMLQAFAKRLRHLGLEFYVVGETTVPSIANKDMLIAASGSGETLTTLNVAQLAKKAGARVILITASTDSSIRRLSDVCVRIPCPTKLHLPGETSSIQPMTNLFEQCLLVFCDCISMILQDMLNISEEEMWTRHCNLE